MKLRILLAAVLLGAPLSSGWGADGKALYEKSCKTCHGASGEGNAKIAAMLKVEIRHLGSPEVQAKSDAELKKAIVAGVGKMKPVKMSGSDADSVVAFVRTLKQK
jgi:mono/diheme cytochrome c family protein